MAINTDEAREQTRTLPPARANNNPARWIKYAEWIAADLNRLFREGATAKSGHIEAATILDGLRQRLRKTALQN